MSLLRQHLYKIKRKCFAKPSVPLQLADEKSGVACVLVRYIEKCKFKPVLIIIK
jgi:hypothetical protein